MFKLTFSFSRIKFCTPWDFSVFVFNAFKCLTYFPFALFFSSTVSCLLIFSHSHLSHLVELTIKQC